MHPADGLRDVARKVRDGLPLRDVWPALHGVCYPVDDGYPDRVGAIFAAVRSHLGTSRTYAGSVLRSRGDSPEAMAVLLEDAAARLGT